MLAKLCLKTVFFGQSTQEVSCLTFLFGQSTQEVTCLTFFGQSTQEVSCLAFLFFGQSTQEVRKPDTPMSFCFSLFPLGEASGRAWWLRETPCIRSNRRDTRRFRCDFPWLFPRLVLKGIYHYWKYCSYCPGVLAKWKFGRFTMHRVLALSGTPCRFSPPSSNWWFGARWFGG